MLGFGLSAKPRGCDYPIALQADLCMALLAAEGVGEVHVLAHDYGDTVAQELLAREREGRLHVASMVFLNGGLFPETHRARPIQKLLANPIAGPVLARLMGYARFEATMLSISGEQPPTREELQDLWVLIEHDGGRQALALIGHSITYRIAVGPRAGQKLFTLQTVPAREPEPEQQGDHRGAANADGFSLHAGLDIQPHQREKLERLCRYVSRPPIAVERLALTASGQVRYTLKTPYSDGTTHIVLEPLDLMARLAALVPPPRMHLTRFHGVFAPHSKLRAAVTPAHRGVGSKAVAAAPAKPITPRHVAMSWAQRLKRVFGIEINTCTRCGGKLKVIASIEEPEVIAKILAHLQKAGPDPQQAELPLGARAPPTQALLI
jgi:hypothetical protein